MEAFHRSAIRLLALLLTVLLTEIALGAGQSVTAVSSRPCRVVNVTQGKHFPPDSGGAILAGSRFKVQGSRFKVHGSRFTVLNGTRTVNPEP